MQSSEAELLTVPEPAEIRDFATEQGIQYGNDAEDHDVNREEAPDCVDDAIRHGLVTELDRDLGARVNETQNLADALLVNEQPADDLDATGRGTRGSADKTREYEQNGYRGRPRRKVISRETGRRRD